MENYETIPLHWVNRLGFLVRKELARRFQKNGFDVSPEEWAILLILWNKGAQSPSALADATIRDRTTVTRMVDGMVRKDFVERFSDPKDRRKMRVQVSDLGKSLEAQLVPIAKGLIAPSLKGLGGGGRGNHSAYALENVAKSIARDLSPKERITVMAGYNYDTFSTEDYEFDDIAAPGLGDTAPDFF